MTSVGERPGAVERGRAGSIEVLAGGPFTTVQDLPGRIGYWHVGVPPNGPMDDLSHCLANRVVGNSGSAAALELTGSGPTLRFDELTVIALGGAAMSLRSMGCRGRCGCPTSSPPVLRWRSGPSSAPGCGPHSPCVVVSTSRPTWAAGRRSPSGYTAVSTVGCWPPVTGCASVTRSRPRRVSCHPGWGPGAGPPLEARRDGGSTRRAGLLDRRRPAGSAAYRGGRCTSTRLALASGSSGHGRGGRAGAEARPVCTRPTSTTPATPWVRSTSPAT